MIDWIMEACSFDHWIIFLWFSDLFLAFQVDCPQFSLYDLFFLLLLFFGFFLCFLILLCLFPDKFLYFLYFFLGSSHMMIRAAIRTFIRFLLRLFFIFFNSFLNLLNFFLIPLKIRLIFKPFSALNSTFAEIWRMIPFIIMRSVLLCTLLSLWLFISYYLGCIFQGFKILFDETF